MSKMDALLRDYKIKTIDEMKVYLLREGFSQDTIDKMNDEKIKNSFETMLALSHWD